MIDVARPPTGLLPWRLLKRVAGKVRRELAALRAPTRDELDFIDANRLFWRRVVGTHPPAARGSVLTEPQFHAHMFFMNANMAAAIAVERGLTPLFLIPHPFARAVRAILRSYPRADLAYVFDLRGDVILLIRALLQARAAYAKLTGPDDILGLTVDGIVYGDLVYDTVLQQGYATVDRVDRRTYRELVRFFYYRLKTLQLLRRYPIAAAAFTGRHSVVSGTMFRHLTQRRIEVVVRTGPSVFAAMKYRDLAEAKVYEFRPEPRYVRQMLRRADDLVPAAELYLRRRLANDVDDDPSMLAFDERNRTFDSRAQFCEAYGLDPAKPMVFVLLHAFNDHPHMLGRILFRDYRVWLERTLEIAREVDSVSWIFKEHPAAAYYYTSDFDFSALAKKWKTGSTLFLDKQADFNARSLPHLAHAIVTCIGTAGLEYSALGIPCVLGGYSPYSGLGFTIEPRNAAEYGSVLRGIASLPRLRPDQATVAKLVAYFYLHIVVSPRDPFFRYLDWRQIADETTETWRTTLRDAIAALREEGDGPLSRRLASLRDFLRRPEYVQYVDFDRFPFLREALDEPVETVSVP